MIHPAIDNPMQNAAAQTLTKIAPEPKQLNDKRNYKHTPIQTNATSSKTENENALLI